MENKTKVTIFQSNLTGIFVVTRKNVFGFPGRFIGFVGVSSKILIKKKSEKKKLPVLGQVRKKGVENFEFCLTAE